MRAILSIGVLAILFGAIVVFQLVLKPQFIAQAMSQQTQPPTAVSAQPARPAIWQPTLTGIGTLRAEQEVDIAAEVPGVVSEILFRSGQSVAEGDTLIRLDDRVEQADLELNRANLREADLALNRARELFQGGNTPRATLDTAQAQRDVAAASLERIRAQIARKELKAPFSGRVGIRQVDLGEYLAPGMAGVTLQSIDPIYVDVPLPERALSSLRVDQTVEARVDAHPGRVFRGTLETVDARVDSGTRTILVRAAIDNPDGALLPGMFADIAVEIGGPDRVVVVPQTAISYSLYGDSVFLVVENEGGAQVATRRYVTLGERRGDLVAILDGVAEGDQVVTAGQVKLREGMPVVIDNDVALAPQEQRPKL